MDFDDFDSLYTPEPEPAFLPHKALFLQMIHLQFGQIVVYYQHPFSYPVRITTFLWASGRLQIDILYHIRLRVLDYFRCIAVVYQNIIGTQ